MKSPTSGRQKVLFIWSGNLIKKKKLFFFFVSGYRSNDYTPTAVQFLFNLKLYEKRKVEREEQNWLLLIKTQLQSCREQKKKIYVWNTDNEVRSFLSLNLVCNQFCCCNARNSVYSGVSGTVQSIKSLPSAWIAYVIQAIFQQ